MTWIETTLGEVLPLKYGKNLPATKRSHSGEFDVVTSAGIVDSHFEPLVPQPSVVIGRKGTIGSLTYCAEPCWPTDTTFFTTGSDACDVRFGYYFLQTAPLAEMNNDSAVPGLNRGEAESLPIRIPELSEQKLISRLLGSLDDKIAANRVTASLSRFLIRSIAEGLEKQTPLAEFAVRNKRSLNPSKMFDELVLHFSIPRFDAGSPIIEPADAIKSSKILVQQPSVLVSKLNPETPRVWSVPRPSDDFVSLASTEFISLEPDQITQSQLYAATLHPDFHQQLASLVGGTSKSHQRVKPDEMLQCLVPDVRELSDDQIRLLETLSQLEAQAVQEMGTLAKTRDELLPLLMSGKITVKEAEQDATAAGADIAGEESGA